MRKTLKMKMDEFFLKYFKLINKKNPIFIFHS